MVASEVAPFAKTGGLADVVSALPPALGQLGHRVTVVTPRYRGVDAGVPVDRFMVPLSRPQEARVWEQSVSDNTRVLFVECAELFDREGLYGAGNDDYADNPRRFAFLARAALEIAARQAQPPHIIHAHDWQSGLAAVYLRSRGSRYASLERTATVFTIHNLAYQGLCAAHWLPELDLDWSLMTIDGLEYWGRASFLKGGINFSDVVTTVSPTYAREIQTSEYGFGFEGILARRSADLVGILNGIDVDLWNAAGDPRLPRRYDEKTVTEGKRAAKRRLLQTLGLSADAAALRRPLIGMIARMVDQKGLDILAALGDELGHLDAGFAVLGTGEVRYQDFWLGLASRHPDRVGVRIGFDEALAHLIEGGADMFLMPSRFEPCGLSQMYSLRYGTVPIVRATGGLDDTVVDCDAERTKGTGFKFAEYTSEALRSALNRALAAYAKPRSWKALQARGMRQNFSWDRSAREYVKLYEAAWSRKQSAVAPWSPPCKRSAERRGAVGSPQATRLAGCRGPRHANNGDSMASDNVQIITDGNFEEAVIKAPKPVLVDFWAEWCAPCRRLAPTVDALASELQDKLTVGKLNVDENPYTAGRFSIRGIPTLLLFKDGQIVESVVGLTDKEHLKQVITPHLP